MASKSAHRTAESNDRGIHSTDDYITVNCAGYYESDDPGGMTRRTSGRNDYLLCYNDAGHIQATFGGQPCHIAEGVVFIYKPNEEQRYGRADGGTFANYWVHFTGYGVMELLMKANLWDGHVFPVGRSSELIVLMESMIDELAQKRVGFESLSASFFHQLIFQISRKWSMQHNVRHASLRDLEMSRSLDYLHKNFDRKMTVRELADRAGLSPTRYSAVFRAYTGCSPQQYLIHYRLQRAKEWMLHTHLSIKQIASLSGFEDQLHFSKLFKKHEKMSPFHYKQEHRSG